MDLVLNELSFYPCFENIQVAESKFLNFINTFKKANEIFGIKRVLFPKNITNQKITDDLNFVQVLEKIKNKDLQRSLFTFIRPPYLDDLSEEELNAFLESGYTLIDDNVPTEIEPVGLPVSYIKTIPAISFDSHLFWRNRKITVRKSSPTTNENIDFCVYNICLDTDITSQEINEWAEMSMPKFIDSREMLVRYLGFTKYQAEFTDNFMEHFFYWKSNNFDIFKYLLLLMKDIQIHPFTGGMGQTENLKSRGKEASKRITNSYPDGDRLSYTVGNNIVTFIACKGHYTFH